MGSYPFSIIKSFAASVIDKFNCLSAKRLRSFFNSNSTTPPISSLPSGLYITISSNRFKNSGRKLCFSNPSTASFACWVICPFSMPSKIYWLPKLLVRIRIVFLKSTVLPWLSVIRPSSSTCNSTLNTSGCAFSISSNSTTLYGLRRTASVS